MSVDCILTLMDAGVSYATAHQFVAEHSDPLAVAAALALKSETRFDWRDADAMVNCARGALYAVVPSEQLEQQAAPAVEPSAWLAKDFFGEQFADVTARLPYADRAPATAAMDWMTWGLTLLSQGAFFYVRLPDDAGYAFFRYELSREGHSAYVDEFLTSPACECC